MRDLDDSTDLLRTNPLHAGYGEAVSTFELESLWLSHMSFTFAHSSLHSGSDESFDCHFRRTYLVRFGNGRIPQIVVFSIWKTVTAFDVWIASNVKRFYNAFPHQASVKYFYDWRGGDMSRHAPDVFLHSALNVKDSLCHTQPSARGRELSRAS